MVRTGIGPLLLDLRICLTHQALLLLLLRTKDPHFFTARREEEDLLRVKVTNYYNYLLYHKSSSSSSTLTYLYTIAQIVEKKKKKKKTQCHTEVKSYVFMCNEMNEKKRGGGMVCFVRKGSLQAREKNYDFDIRRENRSEWLKINETPAQMRSMLVHGVSDYTARERSSLSTKMCQVHLALVNRCRRHTCFFLPCTFFRPFLLIRVPRSTQIYTHCSPPSECISLSHAPYSQTTHAQSSQYPPTLAE